MQPTVKGRDGFEMPIVGFGTWQATEEELETALNSALEAGYRHIDTAYAYDNEKIIGKILKEWMDEGKLTRDDLFITTKLPTFALRPEHITRMMDLSLKHLQLDYVDMYLVHCPVGLKYHGDYVMLPHKPDGFVDLDFTTDLEAVWKVMEEQVVNGKARHIGVSNFSEEQVGRILASCTIPPANNQIQLYLYLQQPQLVKYLQDNGIVVTSYSTLGSAGSGPILNTLELLPALKNETVLGIAEEVGRTPAQVLLRHMMQKDIVVIPKSITPARIQENFELFDFELSDGQMERLNSLDKNLYCFSFKNFLKGIEAHPEYHFAD